MNPPLIPPFPPVVEDPTRAAERAALIAAAEEERARRRALPCYASAQEQRLNAAVDACEAAGAAAACEFYRRARQLDGQIPHMRDAAIAACPRYAEAARVDAMRQRLEVARVPERHIRIILRAMPMRLVPGAPPPVPMEERDSLEFVREFFADENAWVLLLMGESSVGKSGAAAWAISQTPGGLWVTAREIAEVSDEAKALRQRARGATLLVIDDCGKEYVGATGYSKTQVEGLIFDKYDACEPLILTLNGGPSEMKGRYDTSVIERLVEDGMARVCKGESLRRKTGGRP